ncbi:N-acetylmuramoyl-L-alanine amidase [Candidatus Hydrogenedentota bacterium]
MVGLVKKGIPPIGMGLIALMLLCILQVSTEAADFRIKNASGNELLRIEDDGDMVFSYRYIETAPYSGGVISDCPEAWLVDLPACPEFIIRDSVDSIVAVFDSYDGRLYIKGEVYEDVPTLFDDQAVKELMFADYTGVPKALINEDGDLKLSGRVYPRTVVLDPGHGGSDDGAFETHDGNLIKEKDKTLEFASELKEELETWGTNPTNSVRVVMTRTTDVGKSLMQRAKAADMNNAACLLSLHFNGSLWPGRRWSEILVQKNDAQYPARQVNWSDDDLFADAVFYAAWNAYRYYDYQPDATPPVLILEPGHSIPELDPRRDQGWEVLHDDDEHLDNVAGRQLTVGAILELDYLDHSGYYELWCTEESGETNLQMGRKPSDVHADVTAAIAHAIADVLQIDH